MAFRTVAISNDAAVSASKGQLHVVSDTRVTIPLEDVAVLLLEGHGITITSHALASLAEAGAVVISCDRRHMPVATMNAFCTHSRTPAILDLQLSASLPMQKRLWQKVVEMKIGNQALCLKALGADGAARLREYASQVRSGDTSGREAAAARYYFARLMPQSRRHDGDTTNQSLDYGYAILRAALSRSVAAHGLYPSLGIHHHGGLNAFNLADDLIEPFRPLVDHLVIRKSIDSSSVDGRKELVGVLNHQVRIDSTRLTTLAAADQVVTSLVTSLRLKDAGALCMPSLEFPSDRSCTLPE